MVSEKTMAVVGTVALIGGVIITAKLIGKYWPAVTTAPVVGHLFT
jgi:hypothetical protein